MRRKIQTDKRIVTTIITDIDMSYDDLKAVIIDNKMPHEGLLLEVKSGTAYLWETKKPEAPMAPMPPLDAIRA